MLTRLSIWALYLASYFVDYVFMLIILVIKRYKYCEQARESFWNSSDLLVWGIFLTLIILSLVIASGFRKMEMNTRICAQPEGDLTFEITMPLIAKIVVIVTTFFTEWWPLIDLSIFLLVGILFVRSKAVQHGLLFAFPLGNHVFSTRENGITIISNYRKQELRIAMEDNIDGLPARELVDGVFYIRK